MTRRFPISTIAIAFAMAASRSASAATLVVAPGQSIQAAVDAAAPGDRIQVLPGTYAEGEPGAAVAVTVTKSLHIEGRSSPGHPVVLENAGAQSFGLWASPADSLPGPDSDPEFPPCFQSQARLADVSLTGFTLRGFVRHGAHLACVDGFELARDVADGNGEYGLFPVVAHDGDIVGNEVMNTATDAGIYVGESDDVRVTGNLVHDNLLGIELENSTACSATNNVLRRNTVGILVDLQPFFVLKTAVGNEVRGNVVLDNNRPNTADPDDIPLALIPPGVGILLVSVDGTRVEANHVAGNGFAGISVISFCTGLALAGLGCEGIDIDPFPDDNRVVHNLVIGNGFAPGVPAPLDLLQADLSWDGTGSGDCWSEDRHATSQPDPLPSCP